MLSLCFLLKTSYNIGSAGIAQLVERNLAKVEVASSSLVSRSTYEKGSTSFPFSSNGAIAKRLCTGLQIRLAQFDSGSRLQSNARTLVGYVHFFVQEFFIFTHFKMNDES